MNPMTPVIPIPRHNVTVRTATMSDLPFLDSLQKVHTHQVGWMPTKQLEGKIKLGHVIVAQDEAKQPMGYCIGSDQYFKRDDVGIIYQLNVLPTKRRGLVGATLVKAMFDRAAYGCRLFCCWCAQDIEANYFWESLGFIPLAFRAGSRGKRRVHIFWQRRIRAGDTTTPYWFPSQTSSGSIREDRLVLPIPPGTHWGDAKPIVLPGMASNEPKQLPAAPRQKRRKDLPAINPAAIACGGLRFAAPKAEVSESKPARPEQGPREPKPKVKHDLAHIAAARELRDRWLEEVNSGRLLPASGGGKYEVSRRLDGPSTVTAVNLQPMALLEAA